jgi:hypothetical protein
VIEQSDEPSFSLDEPTVHVDQLRVRLEQPADQLSESPSASVDDRSVDDQPADPDYRALHGLPALSQLSHDLFLVRDLDD